MIGGVLVERTVDVVLPGLASNRDKVSLSVSLPVSLSVSVPVSLSLSLSVCLSLSLSYMSEKCAIIM